MQIDLDNARQMVRQAIPHVRALGIDLVALEKSRLTLRLPYDARLVGNPETGVLHGGVITTLLDTVAGLSVYTVMDEIVPIATLDLRIDYLKPATPGRDVLGYAHCYRRSRNVAFVWGLAYHDDRDDPIAHAAASFMLSTAGQPPSGGEAGR
jgi:uncharacterized protein (TIGR00369 family)